MASRTEQERVPVLKDRASFPDWERKFNDFATGEKLHDIMKGIEVAPVELTPQELQLIPAASRYLATSDRTKKIDYYADRNNRAFAAITKAMEKDMIYGSAALDNLRDTVPRDSAAAYQLVMDTLKPSHVDAQMTVEALITTLKLNEGETPPALIQRLATYVQRLPAQSRPDDITMMKTFKRALKSSSSVWPNYREKVESLMDQEPAVSYAVFCDRIQRKHDQLLEERAQDAALHTEAKQNMKHVDNEEESAHYTKGKKGKGSGRGKSGKGNRGDGRQMGKGYDDARLGSMYAAQGYRLPASDGPFWRGGGRHDGGRGYSRDSGHGKGGRGGGKGKDGGKGDYYTKPKFDGNCNKCGYYGHKEADCYSNKKARY